MTVLVTKNQNKIHVVHYLYGICQIRVKTPIKKHTHKHMR